MSIAFAAAIAFAVAFTFCVIAAAWNFCPHVTQPYIAASVAGLVVSVVRLHLEAGDG